MRSLAPADPSPTSCLRLFLTGGTGFVGRTILDHLIRSAELHGSADMRVVVLSRNPTAFLKEWPRYAGHGWLRFLEGDLQSLRNLPAPGFDQVIHAAADTHGVTSGARWAEQIIAGTQTVLDYAVANGARRFLLLSSGAVYGKQPSDLAFLHEDFAGAPSPLEYASVYGQAKRMAEQLCTVYQEEHGLDSVIARCFSLVGEHVPLSGPYAIGNFIRDALNQQPLRLTGDGTALRSYLYGPDAAHWLMTLLLRGVPGQAYNVGSDEAISIRDLALLTASCLSHGLEVLPGPVKVPDARSRYIPDIRKASQLELRVTTSLRDAIVQSARLIATGLLLAAKGEGRQPAVLSPRTEPSP